VTPLLHEFMTVVVLHALAVVSPGPDFAMVLRQSLRHGRATAVWCSVGIGCGLAVHIAVSLLGLGILLKSSTVALATVKWLGVAYLAWIGFQALRAQPREPDGDGAPASSTADRTEPGRYGAWSTGFLVNVLNPKAALFFLSLFPLAVNAATPKWVQAGYGLWMIATTMAWFAFVAVVFTRPSVRRAFLRHGHWIDRTLGVVFVGFAASLAWGTLN
jgi:RhtB (resistance to homoserine/threonine) family protein